MITNFCYTNKFKIIIVIVLSFIAGYAFRPQITNIINNRNIQSNPTVLPSISATPTKSPSPEEEAKLVVIKFEELQKERNPDVLKLFTPPSSVAEADAYSSLMALDMPGSDFPRLFHSAGAGSYKITEYQIGTVENIDNKSNIKRFKIETNESRSQWDNTMGKWSSEEKKKYIFELIQVGANVMVDRYYPKDGQSGKYNGFYY